jgi:hypothetical protein
MDDTGTKRKVLEMIMSMCDDKTLDPLKKKKEASMMPPSDPSSDDSSGLMDKLKGLGGDSSEGSPAEEASESPDQEKSEDGGMDEDTIKKLIEQYASL